MQIESTQNNKVFLSVDVEDWYHGPSVISPLMNGKSLKDFLGQKNDIERGYRYINECLDLFDKFEIKATFFWIAEYAQRFPQLLKEVSKRGHEIACHGLEHYSKLNLKTKKLVFSREDFIERTNRAKNILEELSNQKIIGYRAPNAVISGKMIDWLEELEFQYDSSVSANSFYNKSDSEFLQVSSLPYYPKKGELNFSTQPRNIIEFPWAYYTIAGKRVQSSGGPFLRFFGSGLINRGLQESLHRGHTVFYFHPIDICKEAFPSEFSPRMSLLWLFKGNKVKRSIESVLSIYRKKMVPFRTFFSNNGCSEKMND